MTVNGWLQIGFFLLTVLAVTPVLGRFMVDLDSSPTKLIDIVEIGKQLLMTRGALTTFSIANDVAKYFAIIPAMFAGAFPVLVALNVMQLKTPESAILSAVIFNALIIVALVPLALRGIQYRAMSAEAPTGLYLTPRRASGISAMMISALKMTAASTAELGLLRSLSGPYFRKLMVVSIG